MHKSLKNERLGETRRMNCDLNATITDYKNNNNITVRFPDGTVLTNKAYHNFIKGEIQHPQINQDKKANRTGEIRMMHCGMKAKIVDYVKANDITVEFSDKTIVAHKKYRTFTRGEIDNPNMNKHQRKMEKWCKEHIGQIQRQSCGLDAKIIDCTSAKNITVLFPDGTIITNKNGNDFNKGQIGHPTICGRFTSHVGKIHKHSQSRIYHTRVFGIAHHNPNGDACYYAHCPICDDRAIWSFDAIKNHGCNRELVQEHDALIQELTADIKENVA